MFQEVVFWVLFALLILTILWQFLIGAQIARRLEIRHPEVWRSLGSPQGLFGYSREFQQYVSSGKYRELDDEELTVLSKRSNRNLVILILGFLLLAVGVLLSR